MEIYVVLHWLNHSFMQQIFKPLLSAKHSSRHCDREVHRHKILPSCYLHSNKGNTQKLNTLISQYSLTWHFTLWGGKCYEEK